MAALTAVVVALSVAVAANFLLLLAIVRRLRLQRPAPPAIDLPRVGMQAPAFAVQDVDGNPVDQSFYSNRDVVLGFFDDNCVPCRQVKAELARHPIECPVLAFVHTSNGGRQQIDFADELAGTGAKTVLLEPGSEIPSRFSISAFPTLLRLRKGIVVASSIKLADVREADVKPEQAVRRQATLKTTHRVSRSDRLVNK